MARKSRKELPAAIVPEQEQSCKAGIYVRLSVEDTHTRTCSIESQQMIVASFLERNPEISVYNTYIDNGATGTNFNRPGFQQLLSDIEAGFVNCVIVKDLSRLGRNAIDTGYYIEQYFRIRNIRFIAINENYDTANKDGTENGIMIPLRNMINEAYAMDIARKIKAQQRQAMKDGKYIGARPPYGYLKSEDNCHQLIIDPVAAPIVRKIFEWAKEGAGLNTIAVRLNTEGCLPPSNYKKENGEIRHDRLVGSGHWQTRTVNKILRSEVYTGDLVQGKTKNIDHRQVIADRDNYITVQNTHEAIISHELFDEVQEILDRVAEEARERSVVPYTPNLLKGKVFCAECGRPLHRQRNMRKKHPDVYLFHCLTPSRINPDDCPGVTIREDVLLDLLCNLLTCELETSLGDCLMQADTNDEYEQSRIELKNKIISRRQEIVRLRGLARSLYENLVNGNITKDEYYDYKAKYEGKINLIAPEIETLEQALQLIEKQEEQQRRLAKDAESIRQDHELTAALIDRLIERVDVSSDKQISVTYRFKSEYENCKEVLRQCRNM